MKISWKWRDFNDVNAFCKFILYIVVHHTLNLFCMIATGLSTMNVSPNMPTWSCRLSPTRKSCNTGMPKRCKCSRGPTPDSINSCGLPMLPDERITSRLAWTKCIRPSRKNCTPVAWLVAGFMIIFVTCAYMAICKLGRSLAGRRKALAVLQRVPRRIVPCK